MYIPDGIPGPLCELCTDRFLEAEGPAWYPNNVDRAENLLRIWLANSSDRRVTMASSVVARAVAEYVAGWWLV